MFKFLIEGKTIKELKENITAFFSEFKELQPDSTVEDEQDFLTEAAAQPAPAALKSAEPVSLPTILAIPAPASETTDNVDSKGIPWDARIHASSYATTKDGSWRYKRGVEDSTIKVVEQELIAKIKGGHVEAPVTLPPIPAIPAAVHIPAPTVPAIPAPTPVPVVPQVPPPMPAPEAVLPNAHTVETFKKSLVQVLAKLVKDGKLTMDYVNQLKTHFGVDEIYKVNEQQAEEMFNNFVQYGMIAKV